MVLNAKNDNFETELVFLLLNTFEGKAISQLRQRFFIT